MDVMNTYFCENCLDVYELLEGKDDGKCPICHCKGGYCESYMYDVNTKKRTSEPFQIPDKGPLSPMASNYVPNNNQSNQPKQPIEEPVKCPRCGSTQITTGARGVNNFWGLLGASKTVNRCAKCGNTWKPHL